MGGHLAAQLLSVMKLVALKGEEEQGNRRGHQFRRHDGPPDTVDAPDQREEQDRGHLKQQRTQKRDQRGGQTVVQRSEKGGTENG